MADEPTPLSDRELEILRLVATGATNQEIARNLYISPLTVKVHLSNIYSKLGVASRTEATMVAVRRGWVEVPRAEPAAAPAQAGAPVQESASDALAGLLAPQGGGTMRAAAQTVERWPRVHPLKRAVLLAALGLLLVALFLPQMRQSRARGTSPDAIRGVFPTPSPAAGSSTGQWRTRAQMPTPRNGLAVIAYQGLIYAIGGVGSEGATGRVEVYDPAADAWSVRSAKPTSVGFVAAAEVGGQIYVPGGVGTNQRVQDVMEVYDPLQDAWSARAPMPHPRAGYGLAAWGGQIYLFGGLGERGYTDQVYRYDPLADRWEARRPMSKARGLLSAAVMGDQVYVVGGTDDSAELDNCEIYDPAADLWSGCPPMALRRGGLALVAARNTLYALGGGIEGRVTFNERYDPRLGRWSRIDTPFAGQWRGLGAAFVEPYIYAIGGWSERNLSANEAFQALYSQIIVLP